MTSTYDPFAHAEDLGVQIVYRRLRAGNGLWVPDLKTIFLQPRMRTIHERSILAHEVAHAALGHRDDRPKHEVLADRLAAENLIDYETLVNLLEWTDDQNRVCLELGVSAKLLNVYMGARRLVS